DGHALIECRPGGSVVEETRGDEAPEKREHHRRSQQGAKRAAVAVGRAGPAEETLTGRRDRYGYDHRDRDQEGAEDEAQSDRPSPERAESRCAHGRWDGVAERSDRHAAQQYGGLLGGA